MTAEVGTMTDEQPKKKRKYTRPNYEPEKNALDIWASYKLSQREKSDAPTFDAIFGVTETYVHVWMRGDTGQLLVQPDRPEGKTWHLFDVRRVALPSTNPNLLSATGVVAMAVDVALRTNLSKEEYQMAMTQLFWVYPRTGVYEASRPDILNRWLIKKQFDSFHLRVLGVLKSNRININRLK